MKLSKDRLRTYIRGRRVLVEYSELALNTSVESAFGVNFSSNQWDGVHFSSGSGPVAHYELQAMMSSPTVNAGFVGFEISVNRVEVFVCYYIRRGDGRCTYSKLILVSVSYLLDILTCK